MGTAERDDGAGAATPRCPGCGARDIARIVYGIPADAPPEDVASGRIELAGCLLAEDSPAHRCRACGARW